MTSKHLPYIFVVFFITVIVFANSFHVPFIWDEETIIVKNEDITHLRNPLSYFSAGMWRDYKAIYGTRYLPLRTLSLAVDHALWKLNPFGYHLTNMLLHCVNLLLIYGLGFLLFNNIRIAFFSALLFAVHPMHVETITWIKNRTDLITLIFYLGGMILFIKAHRHKGTEAQSEGQSQKPKKLFNFVPLCLCASVPIVKNFCNSVSFRTLLYLALSTVCYVLTLMSKEMGITLPVVLVLYILCFSQKNEMKARLIKTAPFWIISGVYLYFKFVVLETGETPQFDQPELFAWQTVAIIVKTYAYYVKLLIWPFTFNIDRQLQVPTSLFELATVVSACVMIVSTVFGYFLRRRSKTSFFCFAFIAAALAPVSNIFFIVTRPIAEQRLYLPSVGFCLLVGYFLQRLKKTGVLVLILLVVSYSGATVMRNRDWRDPLRLWTQTLKKNPRNPRIYFNKGLEYKKRGMYTEAIQAMEHAVLLRPDFSMVYPELGDTYLKSGDVQKAVETFRKAGLFEEPERTDTGH